MPGFNLQTMKDQLLWLLENSQSSDSSAVYTDVMLFRMLAEAQRKLQERLRLGATISSAKLDMASGVWAYDLPLDVMRETLDRVRILGADGLWRDLRRLKLSQVPHEYDSTGSGPGTSSEPSQWALDERNRKILLIPKPNRSATEALSLTYTPEPGVLHRLYVGRNETASVYHGHRNVTLTGILPEGTVLPGDEFGVMPTEQSDGTSISDQSPLLWGEVEAVSQEFSRFNFYGQPVYHGYVAIGNESYLDWYQFLPIGGTSPIGVEIFTCALPTFAGIPDTDSDVRAANGIDGCHRALLRQMNAAGTLQKNRIDNLVVGSQYNFMDYTGGEDRIVMYEYGKLPIELDENANYNEDATHNAEQYSHRWWSLAASLKAVDDADGSTSAYFATSNTAWGRNAAGAEVAGTKITLTDTNGNTDVFEYYRAPTGNDFLSDWPVESVAQSGDITTYTLENTPDLAALGLAVGDTLASYDPERRGDTTYDGNGVQSGSMVTGFTISTFIVTAFDNSLKTVSVYNPNGLTEASPTTRVVSLASGFAYGGSNIGIPLSTSNTDLNRQSLFEAHQRNSGLTVPLEQGATLTATDKGGVQTYFRFAQTNTDNKYAQIVYQEGTTTKTVNVEATIENIVAAWSANDWVKFYAGQGVTVLRGNPNIPDTGLTRTDGYFLYPGPGAGSAEGYDMQVFDVEFGYDLAGTLVNLRRAIEANSRITLTATISPDSDALYLTEGDGTIFTDAQAGANVSATTALGDKTTLLLREAWAGPTASGASYICAQVPDLVHWAPGQLGLDVLPNYAAALLLQDSGKMEQQVRAQGLLNLVESEIGRVTRDEPADPSNLASAPETGLRRGY